MALFLLDTPSEKIGLEKTSVQVNPTPVTFSPHFRADHAEDIEAFYEKHRATTPPEYDPENSPILSLERLVQTDGHRTFHVRPVKFKDYVAQKGLLAKYPQDTRPQSQFTVLSMIALLETSDHYLVLGHRNTPHLPGKYLSPAGFFQYTDPLAPDVFAATCREEFAEEVGIDFPEEIHYIGATGDTRDSFLIVANFYGKTAKTRDEVHEAWVERGKKDEHKHMIYLPANPDAVLDFLGGTYTYVLNPYANIEFMSGVCVNGPPEINGKRYEQIENGVGSFADYLSLSLSPKELQKELRRLVEHGTINGVFVQPLKSDAPPYLLPAA